MEVITDLAELQRQYADFVARMDNLNTQLLAEMQALKGQIEALSANLGEPINLPAVETQAWLRIKKYAAHAISSDSVVAAFYWLIRDLEQPAPLMYEPDFSPEATMPRLAVTHKSDTLELIISPRGIVLMYITAQGHRRSFQLKNSRFIPTKLYNGYLQQYEQDDPEIGESLELLPRVHNILRNGTVAVAGIPIPRLP